MSRRSHTGPSLLRALILSLRQLFDPAIRRILLRCIALALATFALLFVAVGFGISAIDPTGLAWLDATLAVIGSVGVVVLAWLLFPVTIAATLGLFAEEVIEAVERRHYPDLSIAPGMGFVQSSWGTVRFVTFAILLNLLALPLYLIPGANIIIFVALNGYLLGREYFELVAQRRLPWPAVTALRRAARLRLWLAGVLIAAMSTVPIFNLIAPVVAVCFMVHLFEGLRRNGRVTERPGLGPAHVR
jgi:CysZ protein